MTKIIMKLLMIMKQRKKKKTNLKYIKKYIKCNETSNISINQKPSNE